MRKTLNAAISARARVIIAGVAVAIIGLVAAGLAIVSYDNRVYKEQKLNEAAVDARILAASVTAALAFQDPKTVQEYVDALRANPEIAAAAVYGSDGMSIASLVNASAEALPTEPPPEGSTFEGNVIRVSLPVIQNSEKLGDVYLRMVTDPLSRRISRYGAIILLLFMAALVVAILAAAQSALRRANAELTSANAELRIQIVERERAE